MAITLNHTIIPTHDNVASAQFYERIFGFKFVQEWGTFAVVIVNENLTLDFANRETFSSIHYAFKVNDQEFDQIFDQIKKEKIAYGDSPGDRTNSKINHLYGGCCVYFDYPNGHVLEIITADYILD